MPRLCFLYTLFAVVAATGCAAMRDAREAVVRNQADDVRPERERRKLELVRKFDEKRNAAQFDAAVSRFEQGDHAASEQLLAQLLERSPSHRQARLLLADVYLFQGRLDKARGQLESAAVAHPDDPAVRHALAEVLAAAGHRGQALPHYERAAELAPENELYTLSYHTALEAQNAAAPSAVMLTSGTQ